MFVDYLRDHKYTWLWFMRLLHNSTQSSSRSRQGERERNTPIHVMLYHPPVFQNSISTPDIFRVMWVFDICTLWCNFNKYIDVTHHCVTFLIEVVKSLTSIHHCVTFLIQVVASLTSIHHCMTFLMDVVESLMHLLIYCPGMGAHGGGGG